MTKTEIFSENSNQCPISNFDNSAISDSMSEITDFNGFAIVMWGESEINDSWNLFELIWTSMCSVVRNFLLVKKRCSNKIKIFFDSLHS